MATAKKTTAPKQEPKASAGRKDNRINLGVRPASPADAWRALSHQAKMILLQKRQSGEFGGTPGKAPYWAVQEYGKETAHIEAKHYVELTLEQWRPQAQGLLDQWLRS